MKKRLLSWLLVLSMVISLIPSTLVTALAADLPSAQASGQAGKTTVKLDNKWPGDMNADITDVLITGTTIPGLTLTVESGKTLIVHGNGTLSGNGRTERTPFFIVKDGGHLVLDNVTVTANYADAGTVVVEKGGLLDLGYNDQKERIAPSITGNMTTGYAAKNLVIADGATVRLNAEAKKQIGVSYATVLYQPVLMIQGGRYPLRGTQETQANGETNITSDDTSYSLRYTYDSLVLSKNQLKMLFWDPAGYSSQALSDPTNNIIEYFRNNRYATTKYDVTKIAGTWPAGYDSTAPNAGQYTTRRITESDHINQYEVIIISFPYDAFTENEKNLLLDFLDRGGTIFFQLENAHRSKLWRVMDEKASQLAQSVGANFTVATNKGIPGHITDLAYSGSNNNNYIQSAYASHPLMKNVGIVNDARFAINHAGVIEYEAGYDVLELMTAQAFNMNQQGTTLVQPSIGQKPFFVRQSAGSGGKFGSLLVLTDIDLLRSATVPGVFGTASWNMQRLFDNLMQYGAKNRATAATGINPNAELIAQATTTTTTETTDYRTPYAALQKAVETSTITLLTQSRAADGGLTPTRDELLFQEATLAYEAGSKYDGSKIHADTAGVYLDITKTGEVNLRSGTVTVTPKDKNYVLTMNGRMDDAETQITGGYKITSATKYQLIADDPTSPIRAENSGKASIVIPNVGESVTVDYGGGKTVTYTAKEQNEKVYLGWYQVKKQTPANMTWTDADKAWHGHTFTTTLEPNVGYEINGENLTIADTDNAMTGGYTLKKQGDAAADPNDNTISWTTYSTDDGKVTVKQQHLHSGGSDRNGIAILTVQDVHADISIGAGNNTVNAKAPTIYVVGIGKRTGHADVQLWEYTTIRNTKDGILDKPVSGWPWEKWKVSSAASGNGTESDYKQNKVTLTSDATKLDTSSETAQYTINLETGDKVVVFYYDWNMVNVTIKATDANGNPIPDYTDQVVEYEIGKQTTITAPNLIGYQPVGGQNTKDFTPSETNKEITFQYEKTTGNLIYKAVYVDAAGAKRELGTFSGGTLVQGQAPNKSAQYAPRFDNYELADKNADGVASAESYTGTDITVTYTYKAKVKTIPVEAYVDSTNGVRLLNDTTTYKDITTGQTITVTAPDIAGYKVKGAASQTVFVTNDTGDGQKVVFLYEKDDDNNAYVLVKLVDSSNGDKLISSYQVPGVKDKAQLIKAPAAPYGYKNDPNHINEDKTVTPTGTQAPYKAEVVFKYVPNVHTVTIKLEDVSETPAKPLTVNNYVASYKVVDSEGLTITAPSIYGYTMAKNSESVKALSNITEDKTVTFEYEPIDKQMVYIHVKGVGPDNKTLL